MRRLNRREIARISEALGVELGKTVYQEKLGDVELILVGDEKVPYVAKYKGERVPTFYFREFISKLPRVVVDRGAANALLRGADLMAPGVRKRPEGIREGARVLVVDESGRPVGIGRALVEKLPERGKVVKMYHVLSPKDKISNAIKERKSKSA